MKVFVVAILLLSFIVCVLGDCYLQHPRGSNDRLNEANTDRDNGNRLFDSQNNAQGGYCVGPMLKYYAGSNLYITWTNQHGCGGNPNVWCNVVLQYMCSIGTPSDLTTFVRDGTTTNTITDSSAGPTTLDSNGLPLYGMHETFTYYTMCTQRQRNMGLFIADREAQGGLTPGDFNAMYTRQNNNVDTHGFECQEEREYYPYWAPTPWKDIAIFTQDSKFCNFYKSHSENVMGRGQCTDTSGNGQTGNSQAACTAGGDTWASTPSHGIPAPACLTLPVNTDNHLGNNELGVFNNFYWQLPTDESCLSDPNGCNCVLRIRYNISTGDVGPNGNNPDTGFIDWTSNGNNSPVQDDEIALQDGLGHELAMDTTQFGRTFQDRSYTFNLVKRPSSLTGKIWNLNVRGKRGNIVEAYPATEYQFAPNDLTVLVDDHIHFQWTGCDTNPAGNAGEGTDQTDRSNYVQIPCQSCNIPVDDTWIKSNPTKVLFPNSAVRIRMAYLDQEQSGQCLSYAQLLANNNNNENNAEQDVQNCMKLNQATNYFDGGAVQMNVAGTYHYMSSRNNNFSNRSQKGIINVTTALPTWGIVIVSVGSAVMVAAGAVGGMTWYARSHPHSAVASWVNRM